MYRDHDEAARIRLDRLPDAAQIGEGVQDVFSRRIARICAGGAALVAALALFALFFVDIVSMTPHSPFLRWRHGSALLFWALAASWLLAPLGYLFGRAVAAPYLRWRLRRVSHPALASTLARASGSSAAVDAAQQSPVDEISLREHGGLTALAAQQARQIETLALALPLAALALLAPLTLHTPIAALFFNSSTANISEWISLSYRIVGHAHLVLMLLAVSHARNVVVQRQRGELTGTPKATAGWHALAWTTLAGALPGVVFLAIPPLLVFVTGMVFVPLSFRWASRRAVDEAAHLGEAVDRVREPEAARTDSEPDWRSVLTR